MFDTDHSGEIDEDEFAMLLEYLGIELSEEELEKMFNRFDTVRGVVGHGVLRRVHTSCSCSVRVVSGKKYLVQA
jgi:Ca2+-binding EF-hand superfamily protein